MSAYYNEIDPFAAAWLRELSKAGHIAPGDVDERSIEDVTPDDLRSYTQVHFFAGIGVWSHALRRAGWPDDRPVWTGSCPCQPFSAAGQGGGFADERHLWPAFHHLIRECRPPVVLGEQVASKDGLAWLDLVSTDMEATGYAGGAVDLCAAGVGAPHIRQRQWFAWLANADGRDASAERQQPGGEQRQQQADGSTGFGMADANRRERGRFADCEGREHHGAPTGRQQGDSKPERSGAGGGMANADRDGREPGREGCAPMGYRAPPGADSGTFGLADTDDEGPQGRAGVPERPAERAARAGSLVDGQPATGPADNFWRDADWLFCRDGKWRPVEPGTFPLAHGAPARVGRLRGYGNAINAEAARVFAEAVLETID